MEIYDTRILVQHPCPFCDLSIAFPEADIALWCNRTNEVLQITAQGPAELKKILGTVRKTLGMRKIVRHGISVFTMTRNCTCDRYRSFGKIADEYGCWGIPPTTYNGGWETHRVLSVGKAPVRKLVSELKKTGKVKILSHRTRDLLDFIGQLSTVPVHYFEGLTDRQINTLVSAFEYGLLDVPAKNRMDIIAKKVGLSRSTYGEHLRKAVYQLLKNSYPFLKLKAEGSKHKTKKVTT